MADCFLKSGQKHEPVPPGDVLKALEYFNIPEALWPEGLIAMAAIGPKYDLIANQLMNTIKSQIVAIAKSNYEARTQKEYSVFPNPSRYRGQHDAGDALILTEGIRDAQPCQLHAALVRRLQHLADDAFLEINFSSDSFTVGIYIN